MSKDFSIYIHVPFCTLKCPYCHFYVIPDQPRYHSIYLKALENEWILRNSLVEGYRLASIFFGGGTPSLLGADKVASILGWLEHPPCEITLEANPERATPSLMREYRDAGVNRVSMGVQSFDDDLLKQLGRGHTALEAINAVWAAKQGGFENISIDLLYEVPRQDMNKWKQTLSIASQLPLTHISLYNLTFEPHTPYFKRKESLLSLVPKPDENLEMLEIGIEAFERMGLHRYEISAFAKPGFASQHNIGYWTGLPFLGLGPSAFSYWDGKRFRNLANLHRYAKQLAKHILPVDFEESLDLDARKKELIAIGLRLLEGVDLDRFAPLPIETVQTIEALEKGLYLKRAGNRVALSEKGRLFYDTVAVEMI